VCYYVWRSIFRRVVWPLYTRRNNIKCDAMKMSMVTNQAQFSLISGTAAFIYWCRVRIEIIYPNRWFYHLIKSLFVVQMRIIISLGLGPRDIIHRYRTLNSDFIERWNHSLGYIISLISVRRRCVMKAFVSDSLHGLTGLISLHGLTGLIIRIQS
jgi:hypothetical protein